MVALGIENIRTKTRATLSNMNFAATALVVRPAPRGYPGTYASIGQDRALSGPDLGSDVDEFGKEFPVQRVF